MRVVLIGATGLVGSHLLSKVDPRDLLVLARRSTGKAGIREKIAPVEAWPDLLRGEAIDIAVSTLGTTWRKAQCWGAFEAVDRTAVVEFASAARDSGARHMITVSSVGADAGSSNRYLALKGQVENDLGELGFERLDVLRPGLLRGRRGAERRLAERLGIVASPVVNLFLRGSLDRFAAIGADVVASAIAVLIEASSTGVHVHHNREIAALAQTRRPGRS